MLKIKKISLSIGKKKIFKKFSSEFHLSETVFIKGKNGSGKTSLLKIIANLLLPNQGFITLGNNDIPISQALQPYCLYISTKDPIRPEFTVLENIKFWLSIYDKTNLLQKVIKIFQIEDMLNESCKKLSAGNLRKISLIRLYVADVLIYLLDEVETNLDSQNLKLLSNIIQEKSQQKSIIFCATNSKPFVKYQKLIKIENNRILVSTVNQENFAPF